MEPLVSKTFNSFAGFSVRRSKISSSGRPVNARRFFNAAALDLKNAIEIFPSSIFAQMLNIKPTAFFTIEEKERQSINASDYFKN